MANEAELLDNLRTEADLCRNETATDIADLLDEAVAALSDALPKAKRYEWLSERLFCVDFEYGVEQGKDTTITGLVFECPLEMRFSASLDKCIDQMVPNAQAELPTRRGGQFQRTVGQH